MTRQPIDESGSRAGGPKKRPYASPRLTEYGSVAKLTRTGTGTKIEGTTANKQMT